MSGDFTSEQKRYLEGFTSGLQIVRNGNHLRRLVRTVSQTLANGHRRLPSLGRHHVEDTISCEISRDDVVEFGLTPDDIGFSAMKGDRHRI